MVSGVGIYQHIAYATNDYMVFWSINFAMLLLYVIAWYVIARTKVPTPLLWTISAILWPLTVWVAQLR